jgi:hypothetical protein
MTPYEILLSESQERMLVVAKEGREDEVEKILNKWELEAAVIGKVTDDGLYRVRENGVVVCEIPGEELVQGCPTYVRDAEESPVVIALRAWTPESSHTAPARNDAGRTLIRLLGSPNIASRRWIYNQYDSTVRTIETYRGLKARGQVSIALDKSAPPRNSLPSFVQVSRSPGVSACSPSTSMASKSARPEATIVANWRVNSTNSVRLTEGPRLKNAPPPPTLKDLEAALDESGSTLSTTRFCLRSSAMTCVRSSAWIVPSTVWPVAFLAEYL